MSIASTSSDMKQKGFELFRRNRWRECAATMQKCRNTGQADEQTICCLGICHLRLGDQEQAVEVFEQLQPPIPAIAALNWAAILACRQKLTEALQVLGQINTSIRSKSSGDAMDTVACVLLADILSVINGTREIESLELTRRCRLLRSVSVGVLPFLYVLKAAGKLFTKLKFPDGVLIEKLSENTRQLCWAYGMPAKPGFVQEAVELRQLKGYDRSLKVYGNVFLRYLDYWLSSEVDLTNFLVGSIKPGDAHALYCLIREKQPSVILEIGTFIGFSASIIAQAVKDNGKGIVHCVDPNIKFFSTQAPLTHARRVLTALDVDSCVRIHEGFFSEPRQTCQSDGSVLGRTISDIVPPVDLAFIDGDHEITAALQDFMLLLPVLNKNATVIFHDIRSWPTVKQGICTIFQDDLWKNRMRYYELSPCGYDGLGIVEVDKSPTK